MSEYIPTTNKTLEELDKLISQEKEKIMKYRKEALEKKTKLLKGNQK